MADREIRYILTWPKLQYLYAKLRKRIDAKMDKKEGEGLISDLEKNRLNLIYDQLQKEGRIVYTVGINKHGEVKEPVYFDGAAHMRPVTVDSERRVIDLGDWEGSYLWDYFSYHMIGYDGRESEEVDPDKFERLQDGSGDSNYNQVNANSNIVTKIKTLYIRLTEDEDYWKISIVGQPTAGFTPLGFTRSDSTIAGSIYIGQHLMSVVNGKNRSIYQDNPNYNNMAYPTALQTLQDQYNRNYNIYALPQHILLSSLFMLLFRSVDIRGSIPRAVAGTDPYTLKNGIGWTKSGDPVFLGLHGFTHSGSDREEYVAGLTKNEGPTSYVKLFPPYGQNDSYTEIGSIEGLSGTGPVEWIEMYADKGIFIPTRVVASGDEGKYFIDHIKRDTTQGYNKLIATINEGIIGYNFNHRLDGGTVSSATGPVGSRFVYIPEGES